MDRKNYTNTTLTKTIYQKPRVIRLKDDLECLAISATFDRNNPDTKNYQYFQTFTVSDSHYISIGDNTNKESIAPNSSGLIVVGLRNQMLYYHKQPFAEKFSKPSKNSIKHMFEPAYSLAKSTIST